MIPLFSRLSTRFTVAASVLATSFVLLMGGGAWLVTERLIQQQMQQSIQQDAALRAAWLADRLRAAHAVVEQLTQHLTQTSSLNGLTGSRGGVVQAGKMAQDILRPLLPSNSQPLHLWLTDHAGRPFGEAGQAVVERSNWISQAVAAREKKLRYFRLADGPAIMGVSPVGDDMGLVWVAPLASFLHGLALTAPHLGAELVIMVDDLEIRHSFGPLFQGPEQDIIDVPVPMPPGLHPLTATLHIHGQKQVLRHRFQDISTTFMIMALLAIVSAVLLAGLLAHRLTRALSRLTHAATHFSLERDDPAIFSLSGRDEIAQLGQAFHQMIDRLSRAWRDLERRGQTLLGNAERIARMGSASLDLASGRTLWSDQFYQLLGLNPRSVQASRELFIRHVHPEDRMRLVEQLDYAMRSRQLCALEVRVCPSGSLEERVCQVLAEMASTDDGQAQRLDIAVQDITDRKRMENRLDELVRNLRRSNEELEQFAYVVSHDLRQPLRTVGSYVSLTEEALAPHLDGETREFMDFIRDGVRRMDALITDLLSYSRVGRTSKQQDVSLQTVIDLALLDLQPDIDRTKALIQVRDNLPTVQGDSGELTRLFQNLIGNAIKYHHPDRPPVIAIGIKDQGPQWLVWVRDNGIGIPMEFSERVFGIFQRLHARNEYEGTGIGLAICRKIVQSRGGRIWFESRPEHGTSFKFTWPKANPPQEGGSPHA